MSEIENRLFATVAGAALVLLASGAIAQTPTDEAASGEEDATDRELTEIVVTGVRRRETVAIDTGASLQVLDGELFKEMNIQDVEQLTFYAPGTTVNGGQVGFLSIRGVGNDSFSAGTEGSSAFFVNGVYRPRITSVLTDVIDVGRAEILRGPQGTQFGRNALGGAVSITQRAPTDQFEAEFDASAGNYDLFRMQGGISGPLANTGAKGRIYAMKEERDGYIDNISPVGEAPRDLDNKDVTAVRGQLDLPLAETVDLALRADWLKSRDTGRVQPITSGDLRLLNQGAIIPYDDIRATALDVEPFQRIDDWGLSATVDVDLQGWMDGLTLTSLSSYREFDNLFQLDGDLTQLPASTLLFDLTSEYAQQEFLFSYDSGGAWQGVFGLFYFYENADFVFDIGAPVVANTPPENVQVLQTESVQTNASAVFTDWSYEFSEKLSFNFGARYTYEEKKHTTRVFVGLINPPIPFNDTGQLPDEDSWTDVSPRVGLEFKPTDNQLIYGLVSKGFTAGNYSLGQREPVEPETGYNYEIGHKGEFLDGRVQTSVTLFWMELEDLQVELIGENEFDVTTPVTANIGEARNRGVEFEIRALPAPWLSFSSAITYLDAEFLKGSAVIEVPDGFQELSLDGKTQTQSPELSASTRFEFDLDPSAVGIPGSARLRLEHQYVDEYFAGGNNLGVLNREADIIESVNLINVRLAYTFPNERWTVAVVGKNITDELVISRLTGTEADFQTQPPDLVAQSKLPLDPRTWQIALSYRY
ncbi:TonB-dependent receptor [Lentisalinibacter orientalis]|uniref:TonB-dependent receptor n=1 Tax=Lentisalinibacter orientalis TaxID=2992241 RepID=UPI0038667B72